MGKTIKEHIDNMNKFQKDFSKGYACAVAQIIIQHGETTLAKDVFRGNFMTITEMRKIGVDKNDIEVLKPIVKELNKRRLK